MTQVMDDKQKVPLEGTKLYFEIPGKPAGKGRPRFARMGKYTKTYSDKNTVNYEIFVKECFHIAYPDHVPLTGYIKMLVVAYFPIPVSLSKKKTEQSLSGVILPDKKPDADNIVKIIADSLNEIAYKDDKQIVNLSVGKLYSHRPRVSVEIIELITEE